jgi:hypothetical protein
MHPTTEILDQDENQSFVVGRRSDRRLHRSAARGRWYGRDPRATLAFNYSSAARPSSLRLLASRDSDSCSISASADLELSPKQQSLGWCSSAFRILAVAAVRPRLYRSGSSLFGPVRSTRTATVGAARSGRDLGLPRRPKARRVARGGSIRLGIKTCAQACRLRFSYCPSRCLLQRRLPPAPGSDLVSR